jgi:hypothetical protein
MGQWSPFPVGTGEEAGLRLSSCRIVRNLMDHQSWSIYPNLLYRSHVHCILLLVHSLHSAAVCSTLFAQDVMRCTHSLCIKQYKQSQSIVHGTYESS